MFNFLNKKKKTAANPQKDQRNTSPSSGVKQSLLSLEQRLMFDAAAAATASEVASEQVAQEQAEAAVSGETSHDSTGGEKGGGEDVVQALTNYMPAEKCVEVAFVDPTVPNYQEMLAGMDPNIEVIMLDGGQDGVQQMASALEGRTGIDAIHLISHGSSGELQLGTGTLNAQSMSGEYASELATIRESLSDHADVLVYGCNFAEGSEGVDAVNLLADLTGADVAASTDQTGHIDLGGDWEFEVQAGSIETDLALTDSTQMNWAGILGTETVKDTFSTESYSNNNGTQSWSSSWTETDASSGGASGGDVRVNSGQLRIDTDSVGNAASRGVNLSGATSATLTFTYSNTLTGADRIEARVSNDGGATYTTLTGGVFSNTLNAGSGSASLDISGYASANTRIQFIVAGTGGGDRLYVDNVQVSYDTGARNSAPTIGSNGAGATASVSVAENSSTVTSVAATDADAGQTLSYSIAGGADAAQFTINSSTGQLSFVSAPNYEAPTDSGGNNVYDVTVQVSDGNGGTDTQAISVAVADANEAPTDLVQSAGTGIDLNTDGGNNSYLYTTNGGAILGGRTAFSIEAQFSSSTAPVSGEHKVLLSYATTGADNEVRVGIAQTSSSTCQLTLTINGSRVNLSGYDASRLFDGGQHQLGVTWSATNGGYNFYVDGQQVGAGTGLQTGYTTRSTGTLVVGMDQDSVGGSFQTSQVFKGTLQDVRVFNDVRTADEISAYLNQDVPTSESGLVVDWTMNNLSGGSTSDVVAGRNLAVGSVSGSGWVASTPSLTWKVAENVSNGTVVGTVTGTDSDSGDTKSYSFTDSAGGRFAINSSTGQITVADNRLLNYESATGHSVTVRVTDSGGQNYTETFTINLTNMNEAPTDLSLSTNTVAENAATGTVVGNVSGTDVDASDTKTYSLTDAAGGRFAINSSTGVITVADGTLLNYENAQSHNITVQVADRAGLTYRETFAIHLTNVNEFASTITSQGGGASGSVTVAENGTGVTTVTATDADAGQTLSYSIVGGADAAQFTINSSTGQLSFLSAPNYEAPTDSGGNNIYDVTVQVSDGQGGTDTQAIAVTVANTNEAPTDLTLSANSVAENATTGTVVGTVTGTDPDASDTKSYSLTDTAGGRFAINASTGQLTVADGSLLNYESATSHTVTVRVTDSGGQSYTETFTIQLTNVNEGPTDLSLSANSVAENATTGTVVGMVTGTDPDAGDTKTYSLTDTAGGRFAINASTGVITVADGSLLNYEAATSHSLTVQVTDSGGQSYNETFTINLSNVNEGPTDLALSANSVAENATTGTVIGTVSGTDPDAGDTKTYSLTDTAGGRFAINASTGVITVADGSLLNYESAASHNLTVQVTDSGGQSYTEQFTINLNNVNEGPTDLALSANSVAENASTGTVVGTVSGTDPDASDTKTYQLTDTAGGRFTINASTGVITVADGSLLNYEAAASHNLTVQVTDSGGQSYTESFTINLTNVNEGPTDLSLSANSVAENATTGTVVGTISGTDPDAGDTKSYSLTDTAGGRFAINASTGQLTVADGSLLNYESAASHTVTVRVTDSGGQSYNETFTINLTNVNEGPTGADAAVTLSEDTSHTLTTANFGFSDVDTGDSLSAVRIDTLPTAGTLTLSGVAVTAGQVVSAADITAGRLVFSPAADGNGTGYASLTFSVQDSHRTYDAAPNTLTFDVTSVNDAPTDLSLSANSVAENASTGTVVGTVRGTDPDAGDTKTYQLTNTAGGRFAINASTGQLIVADGSLLNYESAASHTVTVRVTDSGGQSYNETFTINLSNVNEGPTDLALSANSVAENASTGTVVGTVSGTDPDAGDTKTYQLTDTAGGRFAINASTGVITVADGSLLNYEAAASHNLTVQVTDSGGQSYTESFTINLTNVNEGPTDLALSSNSVAENASTGTVVGTVTGTDPDASDTKTYSLTDTAGGRFAINASTGVITVADGSLLNYESAASHTLTVQVTDSGGQSYTEQFTINLTNVNEGPTDLALSANSVAENATTGTVVGMVTGTDPDAGDTKTYSLTDTAGGRFAIDSATGQLTVADGSLLNYEAAASHTVTVRITDSGGQSHTETFTINLANVNEASLEDVDHRLTTANFGIRDTTISPPASLSGRSPWRESEEDRSRLPDNPRNVLEIKTEGPLPIEIITPGQTSPSGVSTPVEKANAAHRAERLPDLGEKREPDAMRDQTDVQNIPAAEADRKEFLMPDDSIENDEESTALKLSATMGLAGAVLQNGLGNTAKLRRLIPRPAGASNVSPEAMPQQSPVDDHASNQNGSEHSRSTAEDADQAET